MVGPVSQALGSFKKSSNKTSEAVLGRVTSAFARARSRLPSLKDAQDAGAVARLVKSLVCLRFPWSSRVFPAKFLVEGGPGRVF
jgi:hypothetical protein